MVSNENGDADYLYRTRSNIVRRRVLASTWIQSPTPMDIGLINSIATNIVRKEHESAHGPTTDSDGRRTRQFNCHQYHAKGMQDSTWSNCRLRWTIGLIIQSTIRVITVFATSHGIGCHQLWTPPGRISSASSYGIYSHEAASMG